ncbi:uncharacterized protein V1518DRAFT_422324 [Limtongia smithiae]|uniref:uncharacterized protein n=1 Tax=Limtongia smithiae TaxID=1125753 RepID=UPI0034CDD50B
MPCVSSSSFEVFDPVPHRDSVSTSFARLNIGRGGVLPSVAGLPAQSAAGASATGNTSAGTGNTITATSATSGGYSKDEIAIILAHLMDRPHSPHGMIGSRRAAPPALPRFCAAVSSAPASPPLSPRRAHHHAASDELPLGFKSGWGWQENSASTSAASSSAVGVAERSEPVVHSDHAGSPSTSHGRRASASSVRPRSRSHVVIGGSAISKTVQRRRGFANKCMLPRRERSVSPFSHQE